MFYDLDIFEPLAFGALAYLLAHPVAAQAMGACGQEKTFGLHTWERKYPQIRDLYMKLGPHAL